MSNTDVLDDYLGELLQTVLPDAPAAPVDSAAAAELPQSATAVPAVVAVPESPVEPEAPAAVMAAAEPAPAPAAMPTPAPAAATVAASPAPPPGRVAAPAPAPASTASNAWATLQAQAREAYQPRQRRASERTSRWLRLRCGAQAYALELLKVQEVVLPVPLLGLRGTAPSMLGIMNLRGQVVPVIDLGLHLGFAPIVEDSQTRIVVLEENGDTLGLRVSAVEDVANLTDSQIEPPDTARICQISNSLFRGVARLGRQPMILLDAAQLLH